MSKVRIQNQLRKLARLQREREIADLPAILKDCIVHGTVPKNDRVREKVEQIENFYYECLCAGVLPTLPPPPMEEKMTSMQDQQQFSEYWPEDNIPRPGPAKEGPKTIKRPDYKPIPKEKKS
jgi:hypothetical protein